MNVNRDSVVTLLEHMGVSTASKLKPDVLQNRLKKIQSLMDEDVVLKDKSMARLLKQVIKAQNEGEEINIVGDEEPGELKAAKKANADKLAGVKAKKAKPKAVEEEEEDEEDDEEQDEEPEDDDEEDDEEDEDDDEDTEMVEDEEEEDDEEEQDEDDEDEEPVKKVVKKSVKKKSVAKDKEDKPKGTFPRGEGVGAYIVEMLLNGSEDKPISKKAMLARLRKKFPLKEESALKGTLNTQVPSHLRLKKGYDVRKNENGYWIEPEKKSAKKKSKK